MQTILGSGGAIGTELAKVLPSFTDKVRLVSRNPRLVLGTEELVSANLTNAQQVDVAVEGSDVVYLTAGLPYNFKIWRENWPKVMSNVIAACVNHNAKLVFFDNIYMYDGTNLDPIKEDLPINPPSKKGQVRAFIEKMIWKATKDRGLKATIARCADFYGPNIKNTSILTETVFKPLSNGGTANWLASDIHKHSFTFTIDAARATALLGNSDEANGEVWHLPTAANPPTGKQWVEMIASEYGVKPKYRVVGKGMVRFMGLFMGVMRESHEMLYQYDRDYVFNSDKFEKHFNFSPPSYADGIK
jgi:nucleoside-diphosphate-sugar epimerase